MAAEYELRENPNPNGTKEKQPLHPRIVSKGNITMKRLVRETAHTSAMREVDLTASLNALTETLAYYLREGYRVEFGDLGYFGAKLKARSVMDKKEIRSTSIEFSGVTLRLKKTFKEKLKLGDLLRSPWGGMKSRETPEEDRRALVEDFLAQNTIITRQEYSQLTGRLKGKAIDDLKAWVEEGFLSVRGRGGNRVYLKKS